MADNQRPGSLTDAERQRIAEEEAVRAQVRQQMERPRVTPLQVGCSIISVLIAIAILWAWLSTRGT